MQGFFFLERRIDGTIYTLGSSNRKIDEFIGLLNYYQIEVLIDVRSFPTSKFEHFKKEVLRKRIEGEGIGYIWFGKELGGYRKEGYKSYVETEGFKIGIKKVEEIAKSKRIVIMCAERLPWRCHRRFIGDSLSERGLKVIHIIDKDRVWQPKRKE